MTRATPLFLRLARRIDRWMMERRQEALRTALLTCGTEVQLELPLIIRGPDRVRLGHRVCIGAFSHIWGQGGLTIDDDTLIASHVAITTLTHKPGAPRHADTLEQAPIHIGKNVWIGAHAVILPGVNIGDGAVIGAGSIVNRDVPSGTVVAGVPAKALKRTK